MSMNKAVRNLVVKTEPDVPAQHVKEEPGVKIEEVKHEVIDLDCTMGDAREEVCMVPMDMHNTKSVCTAQ
jgi:hypothetical protein